MKKLFSERSPLTFLSKKNNRYQYYKFLTYLKESLRAHSILIAIVIIFAVARIIICLMYEMDVTSEWFSMRLGIKLMVTLFLFFFFCGRAVYIMIYIRPEQLTRYIWRDFRENFINCKRITFVLPIFLLLPIFISTFSFLKFLIPVVNPYSWDYVFVQLDAILHGGIQPWQLLQPILGTPIITCIISISYGVWFFVMYTILLWQAFSMRDSKLRTQFFVTYMAAWILLGNVLATAFSSAGPCYYGRVTGLADPFQPLMDYLRAANEVYPIWALETQEMLWNTYVRGVYSFGKAISAMPSLHISMVTLFAIIGWKNGRALGVALSIYAIIIVVGSIHLGWHYAVDDYVAIVCTVILWKAAGSLIQRHFI